MTESIIAKTLSGIPPGRCSINKEQRPMTTDIINIKTRQPAVTPIKSNPKRSRRKPCAPVTPYDVGDIVDQLHDVKNLATGGVDACFGIEHLTDASCEGPRAIFEAISR